MKKKKEKVKCLQYCKIWLGLDHVFYSRAYTEGKKWEQLFVWS